MASTIAAGTTSGTALAMAGDTSGALQLQTNGTTTAVTLDTSQNATFAGKVTSAGALTLASNGTTTAVTIDTSQNVGIGTASPAARLDINTTASGNILNVQGTAGASAEINISLTSGTGNKECILNFGNNLGTAGRYIGRIFYQTDNNVMGFWTNTTERMRIDSSGRLLIAATSIINGADTAPLQVSGGSVTPIALRGGTNGYQIAFYNSAGNAVIGSITGANGATTAYNTASDYRLKENIAPIQNALSVVQQLNPVTYNWKADGSDGQGFIAHELQAVVPDCVTGEKDATREEEYEVSPAVPAVLDADGIETTPAVQAVKGTRTVPSYQGIDTSFLVATLTAAIQEQQALIIQLQADVAALKGVKV